MRHATEIDFQKEGGIIEIEVGRPALYRLRRNYLPEPVPEVRGAYDAGIHLP